jgi:hypothetical protein
MPLRPRSPSIRLWRSRCRRVSATTSPSAASARRGTRGRRCWPISRQSRPIPRQPKRRCVFRCSG